MTLFPPYYHFWNFDKNITTICSRRIYQPFLSKLSAMKCSFIIIIRRTSLLSFLVTLTFTLSRILVAYFSSKSLILTDWGIPFISIMFRLLHWTALFILIWLFIRVSSKRWNWLSSLPTRWFHNYETSFFN